MLSKTWAMSFIASMVLQNAPLVEGWATMAVSGLIAAAVTWARNDAVKTKTVANPLLPFKRKV